MKKSPLFYPDHDYYFIRISSADYPRVVDDAVREICTDARRELYWSHPKRGSEMFEWSIGESPESGITVIAGEAPDGIMLQISGPAQQNETVSRLVNRLLLKGVLVNSTTDSSPTRFKS